jgi:hypothetical protein
MMRASFSRVGRDHRGPIGATCLGIIAVANVPLAATLWSLRVSADGRGWITILDRRRLAPRVVLLVFVVLAVPALVASIPGGLVVVQVVFAFIGVAMLALGVILIGLAVSKPRGPKLKAPRSGYATQLGDLATMPVAPNETVATVLSMVREVLAWADRTGRTLRTEATPRRAGQYERVFGMTPIGRRRTTLGGEVVVLVGRPSRSMV